MLGEMREAESQESLVLMSLRWHSGVVAFHVIRTCRKVGGGAEFAEGLGPLPFGLKPWQVRLSGSPLVTCPPLLGAPRPSVAAQLPQGSCRPSWRSFPWRSCKPKADGRRRTLPRRKRGARRRPGKVSLRSQAARAASLGFVGPHPSLDVLSPSFSLHVGLARRESSYLAVRDCTCRLAPPPPEESIPRVRAHARQRYLRDPGVRATMLAGGYASALAACSACQLRVSGLGRAPHVQLDRVEYHAARAPGILFIR